MLLTSRSPRQTIDVMGRTSMTATSRARPAARETVAALRRRWPRPGVFVATVALLTAILVWMGVALLVLRGEITSALPGGTGGFIALTAASCLLDLVVAWLLVRDRARLPVLAYLAVRALMAASGVVFLALPSYGLAAAALFASPRPQGASGRPHVFEQPDSMPASAITLPSNLFASDWSQISRPADADPLCAACGKPKGDPIHRADDAD